MAYRSTRAAVGSGGRHYRGGAAVEPLTAAFRQAMAELGFVEGKNFAAEYRLKPESLPQAAADLVRLNVNVIFAAAPAALAAVSKATTSLPVVGIDLESDPVAKGYVKSLARIAIFGVPELNAPQFKAAEMAAQTFNVKAEMMEVRVVDDFKGAMEDARTRDVEAGILLSSPLVFVHSRQIGELALANRLPLISLFGQFPKNGGLIAYGPNLPEMFGRCGSFVGKILQGAKPGDLPIQRPEKFDFVINLKTAEALGLSVPPVLLATADEVIE